MTQLPPYITRELILQRLPIIFPKGLPNRNYLVRELSASTIFCFLYVGAVEESNIFLGPVHVYRMTNEQATKVDDESRINYAKDVIRKGGQPQGERWYADNTREPIRDETLRDGLIHIGVVTSLNLATTSSKPRYQLISSFASLFNPDLTGDALLNAITSWQEEYLSKGALTRLKLVRHSSKGGQDRVLIKLPTGETRLISPGPSSEISKAVIEVFALAFLEDPMVLWLSTSDDKVVTKDDKLAREIGINIEADKNLPDIILVDVAPKHPLLVFIEVVATDGPINDRRKQSIFDITDAAGFDRSFVTFVTAYLDRESSGFKKTISALTWNSFAWFVSEPDKLIFMRDGVAHLSKVLDLTSK
jgi:hypothetical protein